MAHVCQTGREAPGPYLLSQKFASKMTKNRMQAVEMKPGTGAEAADRHPTSNATTHREELDRLYKSRARCRLEVCEIKTRAEINPHQKKRSREDRDWHTVGSVETKVQDSTSGSS